MGARWRVRSISQLTDPWLSSTIIEASSGADDREVSYIPPRGRREALGMVCYVLEFCGGREERSVERTLCGRGGGGEAQ